jgi:hypothetical protein
LADVSGVSAAGEIRESLMGELAQTRARKNDHLAAVDRQVAALRLRRAGLTYQEIASRLGYAAPSSAWRAVRQGLRTTLQEPADDLRTLELARLDALQAGLWSKAIAGNVVAVGGVLAIMKRRASLLGLDAPVKKAIAPHSYAAAAAVRYGPEVHG